MKDIIHRVATQLQMLSEWSPEVVSVRAILSKGHRPKRYKVLKDSRIFTGCPNPVKIMEQLFEQKVRGLSVSLRNGLLSPAMRSDDLSK